MNRFGKIIFCLLGGLALIAGARADDEVLTGDPYAIVVARNIFGLNPPSPLGSNPQDANPPPKIIPNGIMSIFGGWQVLFKVAEAPKPGSPPPKEESYILSEGQRQDDIEVVKIDNKNSIVTFKNHGEMQTLPLVLTQPSSTPMPAPATAGGPVVRPKPGAGTALRSVPTRNTFNAASQIPEGMTPEVQTIAIEAERERTKKQVQNGEVPPLPVTELTPEPDPQTP